MEGVSTSTLEKFKKFIWNLSLSDLNRMEQFPLFFFRIHAATSFLLAPDM